MSDDKHRRVLVALTYGFSVRYAVPTGLFDRLGEVCHPVAGLGWDDTELAELLESSGIEVVRLPEASMSHAYRNHARRMDLLHVGRLNSPTTAIRRARWKRRGVNRRRFIEDVRILRDWWSVHRPGGAADVTRSDTEVTRTETNLAEFTDFVETHRLDAVLSFTPYHDQDTLLLVAARERRLASMVSIISFDNPTIRGRLPVVPDRVMVWNREMADQVTRSHPGLDSDSVALVGAPQFDLHHQRHLVVDDAAWRRSLGLPSDRPIILYGAGPSRLVPDEHRLVQIVDQAISDGRLPDNPYLLVRRHPADTHEQWARHQQGFANAVVAAPWASSDTPLRSWPTEDDLRMQMSSLAHSVVHVNVCSSMTVDGAMFDRPQIGPTFIPDASRRRQSFVEHFYQQEHWATITASGGLVLAANAEELVDAVSDALSDPSRLSDERRQLVTDVLTWPDEHATERLVAEVVSCLAATPTPTDAGAHVEPTRDSVGEIT